jgi:hypothetical protein
LATEAHFLPALLFQGVGESEADSTLGMPWT